MGYQKVFNKPYEEGYKNLPDKSTPVTAEILNMQDDTFSNIEDFLDEFTDGFPEDANLLNILEESFNNIASAIPKKLSQLEADSTHRTVKDAQIETWNDKSKVVANVESATTNVLKTIGIDGVDYEIEGGSNIKNLPIEEYIELPEEEKKNGDLYLVDGGLVNSPFDMANIVVLKQSNSMNATSSDTTTEVTWNGQSQIALQYYYVNKVDLSNCKYIFYDLSTKNCYGNGETSLYGWDVFIGISKTCPTQWLDNGENAFINGTYNRYNLSNKDYLDEKLDVSNFNGEYYIVVSATGWNAKIYNIALSEDKNSHNIYYNDKKYGGTEVIANPELSENEEVLTGLQVGESKYRIPSYDDTEIREEISDVKERIETTHTTTERTIEDASDGNIVALSLFGNTTQNTEGKNRWSAGNLTVATKTNIAISIKAGNYYFSSTHSNGSLNVRAFFADGTNDLIIINQPTDTPVTIPKDVVSINYSINDFSDAWTNVQLERGNRKTEFEPYISATLPNPQYPQPINGFTGEMVTHGKNFLNCNGLTTQTNNGVTFTPIYENGLLQYINVNGTASSYTMIGLEFVATSNKMICSIGSTSAVIGNVRNGNASGSWIGEFNDIISFTVGNIYTIRIAIDGGKTANNEKIYPMIRLATETDATYKPYQSSTIHTHPLYSIGDVKDELRVYSDGSGELIKRIGSDRLTGSGFSNAGKYYYKSLDLPVADYSTRDKVHFVSNSFVGKSYNAINVDNSSGIAYTPWKQMAIGMSHFASESDLISYLDANEVYIMYQLATPTTTKLTPSEVAEILKLKTFKGKTYIDAENVDFELEYFADSEVGQSLADIKSTFLNLLQPTPINSEQE